MKFFFFFLLVLQFILCNSLLLNTKRYFTKCLLNDESNKTLSCNLLPINEAKMSSKAECANFCSSIGSGQEITFDNQLPPSSLYTVNYTDHGTIVSYGNYSFLLRRSPGDRPLVGEVQVCLGFNYQELSGTCQVFDKQCPASNMTLVTNKEMAVYYTVMCFI